MKALRLLSGLPQYLPDLGTALDGTLDRMKNMYDAPARRGRMVRWGIGITLAGFVAGGAFAAAAMTGGAAPTASATAATNSAEVNALLSASRTAATSTASPATGRVSPLRRLRAVGGYYGSITFRGGTLWFERGTIESVSSSDVVVRAPDGTTIAWQLVKDTVVRDRGQATTGALSNGELVFVGGPIVSGAKDARLIVVRTGTAAKAPASPSPASSPSASAGTSVS